MKRLEDFNPYDLNDVADIDKFVDNAEKTKGRSPVKDKHTHKTPIKGILLKPGDSVWPPPAGITVLREIIPSQKTIEKYQKLLLDSLPESTRKVIEKIHKNERTT